MEPYDENEASLSPEQPAPAQSPETEPQPELTSVFGDLHDIDQADIFQDRPASAKKKKPAPEPDPEPEAREEAEAEAETETETEPQTAPVYPNEAKKQRKKRNVRSYLAAGVIALICVLIVGTVWFLVRQRDRRAEPAPVEAVQSIEETPRVRAENAAEETVRVRAKGFPVSFSSKAIRTIRAIGSHIYVLTDESLSLVSSRGGYQLLKSIDYVEPVIKSGGKYGLVFDRLSGKYLTFSDGKVIFEGESAGKGQILSACISEDGAFVIVSKGNESASLVSYYSKRGELLFQWACAKDHVVTLALAENGNDILCAALNAENGEIVTKLYLLNIYSDQTQWEYTLTGVAAIDCAFLSGSKIAIMCADRRIVIDVKKNKPKPNEYEFPETLLAFDSDEEYTAIVTPQFGAFDAYEVRLLTGSNKESYKFQTNERVIGVCCAGKRTYLLTEDHVLSVSPSGKGSIVSAITGGELGLDVLNGHVYHYTLGYLFKN